MSEIYASEFASLAASLASLVIKGTTSAIAHKIHIIKTEKDIDKIRNAYDEIVNTLIGEREEAIRIAQIYKAELERVVISDQDIEHLHNTVSRLVSIISLKQADPDKLELYEQFVKLISVDTLKAMQLLGFNFKAAIGEPLTDICSNAIQNWGGRRKNEKSLPQSQRR